MIELKTLPYLEKLPEFLVRYGDVICEPPASVNGRKFRIVAGDVVCTHDILDVNEKLYSNGKDWLTETSERKTYLICRIVLPNHNSGEPMSLCAVYKEDGSIRRLDAWGEREGIPFP